MKSILLTTFLTIFVGTAFSQIEIIEAGPSFGFPVGKLKSETTVGVGFDLRLAKTTGISDDFTIGAKVMYMALLGKNNDRLGRTGEGETVQNVGLMAGAEYIIDDLVVLAIDLGLGITINGLNTFGFANSFLVGYKIPNSSLNPKVGLSVTQITNGTTHIGIKGTIQF